MRYLTFLALFIVPPLVAMAVLGVSRLRRMPPRPRRRGLGALAVYTVFAVVWTAPWDGYLIAHDVWRHGAVVGRLLRVPLEEYAFMVGQCLITGLLLLCIVARPGAAVPDRSRPRSAWAVVWGVAAASAWLLHPLWMHGFYLTAIVGWFAPLIAVQVAVGGDRLTLAGRGRLVAVALPTAYLWIVDRIAIGAGAWWINPALALPLRPFGLPVEEALFFLLTNLLLVNGLLLALDEVIWTRALGRIHRIGVRSHA